MDLDHRFWIFRIGSKEALSHLGLESVTIASPYPNHVNEFLARFLVHAGFRVVAQKGLNVEYPAFLPPESASQVSREANRRDADGIVISCTNFRSLEVLASLEADLGKPVISSNMASMWKLLQLAGIRDKVPGAGRLLNRPGIRTVMERDTREGVHRLSRRPVDDGRSSS